ncbi:MAG: radical SAM family heme chaperone HemW [Deltaproteobacteria bacterium]|nr:radical SAM family heme chaperone HemW [Deltaproteobacteria bacterium]
MVDEYSIYIHIPFCVSKCIYCDFVSSPCNGKIPEKEYAHKLICELECRLEHVNSRRLKSVYIGGGTPSLLQAETIIKILETCKTDKTSDIEVTVEANPKDQSLSWFKELIDGGVNRFSIGIQSMNDTTLKWMGRRHSVKDAISAIESARNAGCKNLSADFIYGIPGQDISVIKSELTSLLQLNPDHLSAYELTVSKETPLYKLKNLKYPANSQLSQMWETVVSTTDTLGYTMYEVSNFAKNKKRSVHNSNYWSGGEYLGIGAGAHGHIKMGNERYRYENTRLIDTYLNTPIDNSKTKNQFLETGIEENIIKISSKEYAQEIVMLGLRTKSGIDLNHLKDILTKDEYTSYFRIFLSLAKNGLITIENNYAKPSQKAIIIADELALKFF